MKHTTESLAAMSDFEISITLMNIKFNCNITKQNSSGFVIYDYCNDPRDVMPLVFKHNISIISLDGGKTWWAEYDTSLSEHFIMCSRESYQDVNPLRAACCCLILVLQRNDK